MVFKQQRAKALLEDDDDIEEQDQEQNDKMAGKGSSQQQEMLPSPTADEGDSVSPSKIEPKTASPLEAQQSPAKSKAFNPHTKDETPKNDNFQSYISSDVRLTPHPLSWAALSLVTGVGQVQKGVKQRQA